MTLRPIIGLETHVQLKTESKMFCSCLNVVDEDNPNINICPVCTGQPGVLPVVNQQAIDWGIKIALALNCKINLWNKFDRKNYFYPDLPKGYQISQYDVPLAEDGFLEINIDGQLKKIHIERVHLEEDSARLIHPLAGEESLLDFNRAGMPLVEIVTRPDIRTPQEAKIFMQELRLIMRYLDVSDADMEKGQLRCDVNVSLIDTDKLIEIDKHDQKQTWVTQIENKIILNQDLNAKLEIKNLNSFKSIEKALEYEIKRQTELWQKNKIPQQQETRGWDENLNVTVKQRRKENLSDYRYFPEPDLPPLEIKKKNVEHFENNLPELPLAKRKRFIQEYNLNLEDVEILVNHEELAHYIEKVFSELKAWLIATEELKSEQNEIKPELKDKLARLVSGWSIVRLKKILDDRGVEIKNCQITPENMAELITLIYRNKINSTSAQSILEEMFENGSDPSHIMKDKKLGQISKTEDLLDIVDVVIKNNPQQTEEYRQGKEPLIKFFIGQVMKETQGKANPKVVEDLLKERLKI
ncbi:MAG: Asp-tRNA(Asn)/Glu-tRNA(Gln) amidotransferase subunit GatB [Patescibacteria group bacterium]|nr:Asp-tRNA(Asn)/Glu-tRNA(Gln) amidotransferase subunit GatB [Patescibacteria group bacterium]